MGHETPPSGGQRSERAPALERVLLALLALVLAGKAGALGRDAFLMLREIEPGEPDAMLLANVIGAATACAYVLLLACLFMIRPPALAKYRELWPRLAALLGSLLPFAVPFFPPAEELPYELHLAASAISLVGMAFALYILVWLGRSFSITPQARGLVTRGPYRYLRHPLYAAEYVAGLGVMAHYLSLWAILITLAQGALQVCRMHYEERLLRQVFPDYDDYAARTARVLPGIY